MSNKRAEAQEYSEPLPYKMAAMGDSMTEGLFARYSFREGISASDVWRIVATYALSRPSQRIFNIRQRFADHDLSWSTGEGDNLVFSHAERLREYQPNLQAMNFAESGSTAFDLRYQADRLLDEQDRSGELFDYLTVLVGPNDLLSSRIDQVVTPEVFILQLEEALRPILESRPDLHLLLVGVPEIFEIFANTKDLVVTKIWGQKIYCDDLRSVMYGDAIAFDVSHPDFPTVRQMYEDYQSELHELALMLRFEFPESQIKVLPQFRTRNDYADVISIDCFHPSYKGQAELADITWDAGFWGEFD